MADSFVQLPVDSSGKKIDTRTESTNSEHRQVFVLGDPSTNAGVAPVDATKGLAVDLTATGANSTALKVDGSAVTQPVSLAANQSVNVAQVAGTATDTNSGNKSAGTQRVVLATDQPALTNKLLVTPDLPSGASTAAKQPALGTAGTASTDVITVQGIASMTALKTDGSGVTQPVSGTVTANAGTGSFTVAQSTASNLKAQVAQLASISSSATLQNAVSATGNGSTLSTDGMSAVVFTVSGTFTATVTFEGTEDGTNYASLSCIQLGTNTIGATATAPGTFEAPCAGLQNVRARVTWTSGTSVTVTAHTVPVAYNGKVVNANIVSNTATNQSTNLAQVAGATVATGHGTASGAIRVELPTDGTGVVNAAQSGTWTVGSNSATGSAVPANAFYNGVNAQTALPTAATAGNLTGVTGDKFGRTVVLPGTIRDLVGTQTTTISASTSETTIVTAAASTFNDLTALVISNTSATAARLDFRDTTAGSVLFSIYVPAGDVRGVAFNRPVPQTTVNTNWTAQSSASVTDLRVYAVFDKNK